MSPRSLPEPDCPIGDAAARAERQRRALQAFMDRHRLRAHTWATKAGVSSGSIYAFLKGESGSLSLPTLEKLAAVAGASIAAMLDDDLGEPAMDAAIGFALRGDLIVPLARPPRRRAPVPRNARPEALLVAIIQQPGAGLLLREGALLYWHRPVAPPETQIGRACIVELVGQAGLVLADLRRGFTPGRFTLVAPGGVVTEDAEVASAAPLEWLHMVA